MLVSSPQIIMRLVWALSLLVLSVYEGLAQPTALELVEAMLLETQTDTMAIRQVTADARQHMQRLRAQVQAQVTLRTQEQQDFDRLKTLVAKYGSSTHVAQRLQVALTRLQRERARHREAQVTAWEAQGQKLDEAALALDERLYAFDRQTDAHLVTLRRELAAVAPTLQEAHIARVQQALETQHAALRQQESEIATQTRVLTDLMTLHRERKRLLDDSYGFLLVKTFWLPDSQPLSAALMRQALAGAAATAGRLRSLAHTELARLQTGFSAGIVLWGLLPVVFLFLPWAASRIRQRLRAQVSASLALDADRETFGSKIAAAALMVLQTTIWPFYIAFVVWMWPQVLPGHPEQPELQRALITGGQWLAFLLWLDLLGQAIVRRDGWGERYWGLSPELSQVIRRTIAVGCMAALVLMVPRHILLTAPGVPEVATQSLTLARLCFMVFQVVLLALLAFTCWRGAPVMRVVLAESQQRGGKLWRHWPLIHTVVLAGLAGMLILDVQGYRYTARSLWLASVQALLTVLGLLLVHAAVTVLIQRLIRQRQQLDDDEAPLDPTQPGRVTLLQQGLQFAKLMLTLIGVLVVQHLFGFDAELSSVLNAVKLLTVSSAASAAPLWLTLGDVTKALLILAGMLLVTRNLPCLCEVCLFPHVPWDAGFRYAFLTLSRYLVVLVALWGSLTILHMNWSSIQWILAAASVGLGFGLQEIVSNFISGLILLVERPIRIGDIVTVGGESGTVTRITIRATFLQNRANQIVIVPNKAFITGQVTNSVLADAAMRIVVPIGVAYGSDLELVKHLLSEAAENHPRVQETERPVLVHFRGFGDSSLDWELRFFVPAPGNRLGTIHDILIEIDRTFREHGIEIPFPQRDVHVRTGETALAAPVQEK